MAGSNGISRREVLIGGGSFAVLLAACSSGGATKSLTRTSSPSATAPAVPLRRPSPNSYLSGNYAPVGTELSKDRLAVAGSIPSGLRGTLLRNGPNPIAPVPEEYHRFIGDGMVHAIELGDGRAGYRNRWVRTDLASGLLGETPIEGQAPEINTAPNAASTAIVSHGGKILALYEVSVPTEITSSAETIGRHDFAGALRCPMTAHPKVDPVTGELLFFGYDYLQRPYLRFYVADPRGRVVLTKEIDLPGPAMMHDFAITERNVVFLDLPVVYDIVHLAGKRPFPARWTPGYGARVGVMPRDGSADPRWFDVDPCYVFHTVNAYDDGDSVILDVVRHEQMFTDDLHGWGDGTGTLDRWTIDLAAGKVREQRVEDRLQEFPSVDLRTVGRPHRYGYAAESKLGDATNPFGTLLKQDLQSGATTVAKLPPGSQAGEAIFVPASAGAAEDEGWVLSVVYNAPEDRSDLVILDATDFGGDPVATVALPQRVPFGFHGIWEPASP